MLLLPDLEIRAYLSKYLAGSISLHEFEEWFIAETWDAEQSGSKRAWALATEVRSALFDLTTGEKTEADFKEMARHKVRQALAEIDPEPQAASGAPTLEHYEAGPVLTGS